MKSRPILFSAPMVCALLEGRKTQTRRVVKFGELPYGNTNNKAPIGLCPYGKVGDLLWVRETFYADERFKTVYKADGCESHIIKERNLLCIRLGWKPSIHMPRATSRITLEITGVRVERLQDISDSDAEKEGCFYKQIAPGAAGWVHDYEGLWSSINGIDSWNANPCVWVIEFKVHQCNVDALLKERQAQHAA